MTIIEQSRLFTPWTDPQSGVTSYLLTARVAPVQQSFYFTNQSLSADGRYLWFYCAYPPSGDSQVGRTLGVADLEAGEVHAFPETMFYDAAPAVGLATGMAYWCTAREVWRRGAAAGDAAEYVNALPGEYHKGRLTHRLATHLTFSADGSEVNVDAQIGDEFVVGSLPLDGSPFRHWQTFRRCYNHGQFSPTDPDLQLIAQDYWVHPATGERYNYENRMWLIRRGARARPIFDPSPRVGHEWWDPSGRWVWYVEYARGTARVDIGTGEAEMIWPGGRWHSHADATCRYLVGDNKAPGPAGPMRVSFYDHGADRELAIASEMPVIERLLGYHVHPHPQFCLGDRYICYTTTVRGTADVALVPLDALTSRA